MQNSTPIVLPTDFLIKNRNGTQSSQRKNNVVNFTDTISLSTTSTKAPSPHFQLSVFPTTYSSAILPTAFYTEGHDRAGYYGLGSVVFLCTLLGCLVSMSGMLKNKKTNPLLGTPTFYDEDNFIPRHERITVTQVVSRSARFLKRLSSSAEKRKRRAQSFEVSHSQSVLPVRSVSSFVHVPDILNPIPASPPHRNPVQLLGSFSSVDTKIRSNIDPINKTNNSARGKRQRNMAKLLLSDAGSEWANFHERLSKKLSNFTANVRKKRKKRARDDKKELLNNEHKSEKPVSSHSTYLPLQQESSGEEHSFSEGGLIHVERDSTDDDYYPFV